MTETAIIQENVQEPLELKRASKTDQHILLEIRSRLPHLSKQERKIGEYVIKAPADASLLSVEQISRECGTSAASVSRFVNRIGFPSFKSFQVSLARCLPRQHEQVDDVLFSHEPPIQIVRKVFEINRKGLAETEALLDKEALVDIAKALAKARRAVLFGMGGSGVIAKDGEIRLGHLSIEAQSFTDPYQMIVGVSNLSKKDVAFAISHSGHNRHVEECAKIALEKSALVVAITNFAASPLAETCSKVLLTAYPKRAIHAAKSSSHIAQLCIMDCLYFLVAQIKSHGLKRKVDQLEDTISLLIR